VIDSRDVLEDPPGVLSKLCAALGVPYTDAMLGWPRGRRATDGVWAPYWYETVEESTGFAAPGPRHDAPPAGLERLYEQCLPYYRQLAHHRIRG
jgi:hypothetical protein